jgi:DNA-binding FadR family transcriptional regulator
VNATDQEISRLSERLVQMTALHADPDAYYEADLEFHNSIVDAARCLPHREIIAGLNAKTLRFQHRAHFVPNWINVSMAEHSAIVLAIAARDEDAADQAMRNHIRGLTDAISRLPREF